MFFLDMGNKQYKPIEQPKVATFHELTNTGDVPSPRYKLHRFVGYGNSNKEALASLTRICNLHGVPVPVKDGDYWLCGKVEICFATKNKERLNPVWFNSQNGKHAAFTYYTKL